MAILQGQLGPQPPGQAAVARALEKLAGPVVVAVLVAEGGQAVGVGQQAITALQQTQHVVRTTLRLLAVGPVQVTEEKGGEQAGDGRLLQQWGKLFLGHLPQFAGQLLERAVAGGRVVLHLAGIEADGAVPVAGLPLQAGLLAEAGDAQLQRVGKAAAAQGAGLGEGGAGLLAQGLLAGLGIFRVACRLALVAQCASQGVGGPGAAQGAFAGRQGEQATEVVGGQGPVALSEGHGAGTVQAQLGGQVGRGGLCGGGVGEPAQFGQACGLFGAQAGLFQFVALFDVTLVVFIPPGLQGGFAGLAQSGDRLAEACGLDGEVAFGQVAEAELAIAQQAQLEVGTAGLRGAAADNQRGAQ